MADHPMNESSDIARIGVSAPITAVVVHGRGAVVTRRIQLPEELPPSGVDLVLEGVTPLADPGSVRVTLPESSRRLVGVNARVRVPEDDEGPGPTTDRLESLNRKIDRLVERRGAVEERAERLRQFMLAPESEEALESESPVERLEASLALSEVVADTIDQLERRLVDLREELETLQRERDAAELEDRQASSKDRMGESHPTRTFEVRLAAGEGGIDGAELSYAVPYAAKWWPLYSLRLSEGGRSARLTMEALVAQRTGEDWTNVPVGLSTAEIVFDATLPNLPSLKLGKRRRSTRRGFRAPPEGVEQLFSGYDAFRGRAAPLEPPPRPKKARIKRKKGRRRPMPEEVDRDEASVSPRETDSFDERVADRPAPAAEAAVRPQAKSRSSLVGAVGGAVMDAAAEMANGVTTRARGGGGGPGGAPSSMGGGSEGFAAVPPPGNDPGEAWLEFDSLVLAGPDEAGRGRLKRREDRGDPKTSELYDARESAKRMGLVDPTVSRGLFDYRYDSAGAVRVPADGRLHRVALDERVADSRLVWRTVPVSNPAVYREAELDNPFDSPLLSGPVDVFSEGQLVTTTSIVRVDAGGSMRVGLGVDERIRVARNVRMDEESAGLLGGKRELTHGVEVELRSGLGFEATVEVIDRIPVTRDEHVEVELIGADPAPEEYDQARHDSPVEGGLRWFASLAPGGREKLRYEYVITLRAKDEIVGGNRRE